MVYIRIFIFALFLFQINGSTYAEEVILTVTGNTERTDSSQLMMTLAEFESIGLSKISTTTPWHEGTVVFEGVSGEAFLRFIGGRGKGIEATAINDYKVFIPLEDLQTKGLLFATRLNGQHMSIREKGPIFIIYPFMDRAELNNDIFYGKSIWQLKTINFK